MQTIKRFKHTAILGIVLSMFLTVAVSSASAQEKSLYQRLGGYDGISKVVDEFLGRLTTDKMFEKFFIGQSTDSRKRIRQHIVDQFCVATGGPCFYTGREMKTSHAGLGITEAEWNAAAKHLIGALDRAGVDEKSRNDVVAFVTTLKKDIVETLTNESVPRGPGAWLTPQLLGNPPATPKVVLTVHLSFATLNLIL
jgi:hemoglobin